MTDNSSQNQQRGSSSGSNTQDKRAHNLSDADSSKGGSMSGGNFANDPQRAREAGQKGGQN